VKFWRLLREQLGRPEYVHVLINPLPIYGLALAIVGLAIALIVRNRVALVITLVLVLLSSLSALPTYLYGEAAYDRVTAMSDGEGDQWLDEHMARGEKFIAVFYALAGLALVAIVMPAKWPRTSIPLALATLAVAISTFVIGLWIAYAGGRVRHKEFRSGPPLPAQEQAHEH
jgi:hypothetical protein